MTRFSRCLFLLFLVAVLTSPARAASNGDYNNDGSVDVLDVVSTLRAVVGLNAPSAEERERADVAPVSGGVSQPDATLTVEDAIAALQKIAGIADWAVDTLGAPPVLKNLSSEPDTVEVNLTAEVVMLPLAPGKLTQAFAYNGSVPGPTLEVKEGDRVIVHFTNHLPEPTNVHWHGLHIPPESDGSPWNPVPKDGTFEYRFTVPMGSAGTYWYHPHAHMLTSTQVPKGLAGGIIVRAADDPLAGIPEKLMLLTDNKFTEDGSVAPHTAADHMVGREGDTFFVSGKIDPTVPITNGGMQRWRIVNASNARYYRLALSSGTFLHVGSDGGLFERPVRTGEIMLAPAERAEVLVESPKSGGVTLEDLPYDRGGSNPAPGPLELLKVTSTPTPPVAPPKVPEVMRVVTPLDSDNPDAYRNILLTGGGSHNTIDGKEFSMERVDLAASLNATEYWVVSNETDMDHPFHLHGFQFQVVERNGTPEPFPAWKDTVNVPVGGSVSFVVRFTDFPGWRVYHCHILEHEDMGMMAVLDVEDDGPSDPPGGVMHSHGSHMQ